jgi:radical SAM protein with 4Fe4S-binding SPASM domain
MTVHPANVPHLADSVRYFLRRGVRSISIEPIVTHDPSWKTDSIAGLEEAFARVYRLCRRHYRLTGEVPLQAFRRAERDSPHRPRKMQLCGAGSGETLAVDVDGQAHGCVMFVSSYQAPSPFLRGRFDTMKMGDYRDAAFPERHAAYPEAARRTRLFDDKQDKYSSYGACRDCRFLGACGICPVSIGNIPGNTDPRRIPDFPCAWNLVSLKYRSRFPRPATARRILTGAVRPPLLVQQLLSTTGRGTTRPPAGGR